MPLECSQHLGGATPRLMEHCCFPRRSNALLVLQSPNLPPHPRPPTLPNTNTCRNATPRPKRHRASVLGVHNHSMKVSIQIIEIKKYISFLPAVTHENTPKGCFSRHNLSATRPLFSTPARSRPSRFSPPPTHDVSKVFIQTSKAFRSKLAIPHPPHNKHAQNGTGFLLL